MAVVDPVSLRGTVPVTATRVTPKGEQTNEVRLGIDSASKQTDTAKDVSSMSFREMLAQALDTVNNLQVNADQLAQKVATGEAKDIHEVLMAVEEVNIGLQLTMQIRNKIIEAYQEVMRMQV
jgi:flagellar hook-basal body complex protein FliE